MQLIQPGGYETITELELDAERYAEIRERFMAHMQNDGAHFLKPHWVDLLLKLSV